MMCKSIDFTVKLKGRGGFLWGVELISYKHRPAFGRQGHRNTEAQRHRDTETQRHRDLVNIPALPALPGGRP